MKQPGLFEADYRQHVNDLLDLIDEAVRYGSCPGSRRRYLGLRQWLLENARHTRPTIDAASGELFGHPENAWSGPVTDSLSKLIAPADLETLLRQSPPVLAARTRAVRGSVESLPTAV